jgi:hypothetical protein
VDCESERWQQKKKKKKKTANKNFPDNYALLMDLIARKSQLQPS